MRVVVDSCQRCPFFERDDVVCTAPNYRTPPAGAVALEPNLVQLGAVPPSCLLVQEPVDVEIDAFDRLAYSAYCAECHLYVNTHKTGCPRCGNPLRKT